MVLRDAVIGQPEREQVSEGDRFIYPAGVTLTDLEGVPLRIPSGTAMFTVNDVYTDGAVSGDIVDYGNPHFPLSSREYTKDEMAELGLMPIH